MAVNHFADDFEREMMEEERASVENHRKLARYFAKNFPHDLINTSVVIITHSPAGRYMVNASGNLMADELYYGLSAAKKTLI